jgi:uncharacterized damage-inducible protein DinB
MTEPSALGIVRGLYDYHWWANRRLFDVAAGLGEAVERDMGRHFSFPTLRGMFAHLYGADWVWLERWNGRSPTRIPGGRELPDLAALRERWDALETEQRAFLKALTPAGLGRMVEYRNTEGKAFQAPLWGLLQHVPNHATHHRSEVATMITLISGSPPDTGINTYLLVASGQLG